MNRVLVIIVILYVLFGIWVASELPAPDPIVPDAVPIEAGSSESKPAVAEQQRWAISRVPETQNGELK